MKKQLSLCFLAAALAGPASATTWTDWTSATNFTATGMAGSVAVNFSSTAAIVPQIFGGTDYYAPWPGGAPNPDNTDILQLNSAGTRTITFSQAVTGVQLALVSWNVGGATTFNHAFASAAIGCGFWGCGSISPTPGNMGFTASGEVHGTLTFGGPISTLTIVDGSENWHGLTVGYEADAAPVPEPETYAMMLAGLGLLGVMSRRRKQKLNA